MCPFRAAPVTSDSLTLESVEWARRRIAPHVVRTPLIKSQATTDGNVFLKCENFQVTNSFKVRGAYSGLLGYRAHDPEVWGWIEREGVVVGSSGNFAQGAAHAARTLGIGYTAVVPDSAPQVKLDAIRQLNDRARIVTVPYPQWRRMMTESTFPEHPGFFLSSELDDHVSSGIATMGVEIAEQLPEVGVLFVPYGGGNLAYSLCRVMQWLKPDVEVYAVEVSTGAPFNASLLKGEPTEVEYTESFVDGIGAEFVIPAQFYRLRNLLAGSLVVTPREVAEALSSLVFRDKLVCEGAGAAAFAAAVAHDSITAGRISCAIVSGGVIDPAVLVRHAIA
ncbi:threonine/serine dehydratase [Streptomyces mirabilis]|uniref:threonine ammonia-lyase n=1 Tax=Streptomyces mirabilis TaxID=68239 RepID=UPI003663915E